MGRVKVVQERRGADMISGAVLMGDGHYPTPGQYLHQLDQSLSYNCESGAGSEPLIEATALAYAEDAAYAISEATNNEIDPNIVAEAEGRLYSRAILVQVLRSRDAPESEIMAAREALIDECRNVVVHCKSRQRFGRPE